MSLNVVHCLGHLWPNFSDASPLHWPFSPLFLICALSAPPLLHPISHLTSQSLCYWNPAIVLAPGKTHPLHPAVLTAPVFHSRQSLDPCPLSKHVTSSLATFLSTVLQCYFPGGSPAFPRGPALWFILLPPTQCLWKRRCSVQMTSPTLPCRAVCFLSRSSCAAKCSFYLLVHPTGPLVWAQPPLFVLFLYLWSTSPSLSGRFRPVPVLSNSDQGWMCLEIAYMVITVLLGVRQTWAWDPGVLCAGCVTLGKCTQQSVSFITWKLGMFVMPAPLLWWCMHSPWQDPGHQKWRSYGGDGGDDEHVQA